LECARSPTLFDNTDAGSGTHESGFAGLIR